MGCGETFVKWVLFLSNLAFSLAGLALVGLGIAVRLHIKEILDLTNESFHIAPITCMVVGCIVFLIAFFGCCGAAKENNCMLVSYSILLFIMIVIKFTLAILILVYMSTILNKIPQWLTKGFDNSPGTFQELEKNFHCCGPTGPASYAPNPVPDYCCVKPPCTNNNSYGGCDSIVEGLFEAYALTTAYITILVVCIEMVIAVLGLCFASYVRNKREQDWRY